MLRLLVKAPKSHRQYHGCLYQVRLVVASELFTIQASLVNECSSVLLVTPNQLEKLLAFISEMELNMLSLRMMERRIILSILFLPADARVREVGHTFLVLRWSSTHFRPICFEHGAHLLG